MDFKLTIDDPDILDGIAAARMRDNAGREKDNLIVTDHAWVELEVMHLLKQLPRQKCEAEAQAAAASIIKSFEQKMAAGK